MVDSRRGVVEGVRAGKGDGRERRMAGFVRAAVLAARAGVRETMRVRVGVSVREEEATATSVRRGAVAAAARWEGTAASTQGRILSA
jgi:hypothetical protein